jgi:uncharacterized paraquat-inducible protein A
MARPKKNDPICPRCENKVEKRRSCKLCNGYGQIAGYKVKK